MADALRRQRSACKGGLTKILKFLNDNPDVSQVSPDEIETRIAYANDLMARFCKIEADLLKFETEKSEISEFEDDYLTAIPN